MKKIRTLIVLAAILASGCASTPGLGVRECFPLITETFDVLPKEEFVEQSPGHWVKTREVALTLTKSPYEACKETYNNQ